MKLYTFLKEVEGKEDIIIEQVRAENHAQAVARATDKRVNFQTSFYSETIEE
jgi:hypothetical protein